MPPSGPTLPERIAALDLADAQAGAELEAELRAAAAALAVFGVDAERGLADAAELLAGFDPTPWGQRMASAAEQAAALQIEDVTAILGQWRAALESARELVAGLAADELLAPVRELAEQVGPLVEQLGLDALEDALAVPVGAARQAAQGVQDLQIDVLAGARSLAAQITDALDAIDLDAIATTVANALGVVDDAIAEIEATCRRRRHRAGRGPPDADGRPRRPAHRPDRPAGQPARSDRRVPGVDPGRDPGRHRRPSSTRPARRSARPSPRSRASPSSPRSTR